MIDESESGPLVRLIMFGGYDSEGITIIPPSTLSYLDGYFDATAERYEKPSAELKKAYKKIQVLMKQFMIRHKWRHGYVWIGKDAFRKDTNR